MVVRLIMKHLALLSLPPHSDIALMSKLIIEYIIMSNYE